MSDSVGIVTSTQNPAPQTPGSANAPVSPPPSSATESFKTQTAQNQQSQNAPAVTQPATPAVGVSDSNTPISPRIVVDPLAGPITEFLSSNGQIQAQFPSATVVAYLRAGLTSSGFAKPTADPAPQTENKDNPDKSSIIA
jgi:hypothetical protein